LRGCGRAGGGRVGGDQLRQHEDGRRGGGGAAIRHAHGVAHRRRQVVFVLQLQLRIVVQMQGGRGGRGGARGHAARRQETGRPGDRASGRRRRRGRRRWRRGVLDHLHAVGLVLVDDLLIVGVHDGLLTIVIDEVDHLVLADPEGRAASAGRLGARRHAAVRVIHGRGALLHVVRVARLDVRLLLLLVMVVLMVMVMVAVVVMVVLGVERVHCRRFVQVEHIDRLHGRQ